MCPPLFAAAVPFAVAPGAVVLPGSIAALNGATIGAAFTSMGGLQTAALALNAVSTIGQAVSAYQQGKAQRAQANYNAAVARNNQIIAERQAADIVKAGEVQEKQHRLRIRNLKGTQRSLLAASGVEINEPDTSALDIQLDTAEIGELEALTIRNNAQRNAYQARIRAMNFGAEAGLSDLRARSTSPLLAGATTLLSGSADIASRFSKMRLPRRSYDPFGMSITTPTATI